MKRLSLSTIRRIELSSGGLTTSEVDQQRSSYGENVILDTGKNRWLVIASDTVKDPMMWFLVIVSLLFFAIGNVSDGVMLLLAVVPLIAMDMFLHWRTKSATHSLKKNLKSSCRVFRNGKEVVIGSQDVVPGDLIKLSSGDIVPADGIVEQNKDLQVNESVLTGESLPVKKHFRILKQNDFPELLTEDDISVFAGTVVLSGEGSIRVLKTGRHTEYGEIVRSVAEMPAAKTPMQMQMTGLLQRLVAAAIFFCLLLIVIRLFQGHGWTDSILVGLTLAIAAFPEEFPVAFTFFLGAGVYRLAQKRALVRKAVSVENIGRVTHICTDKTGTITEGKLVLEHVLPYQQVTEDDLLRSACAASNPESSDPIDLAILNMASKRGLALMKEPTLVRFPFTESRRKETVIKPADGGNIAIVKGAPETILAFVNLTDAEKLQVQNKILQFAEGGHKLLACAEKKVPQRSFGDEPSDDFTFLGLLAFEDPARPEIKQAVSEALANKIKIIMVTGDHPATARSIAFDIGLGGAIPNVVSSEEHRQKFEKEYLLSHPLFLEEVDVVARCTPIQKLNIVMALQQIGNIVAVTGDGINDVPALKAADIGIAMGQRGTQSAKEVSSIILADDNFKTIIAAIEEGRRLFQNIRDSFEYLMLIHIPLVLSAALIPLAGLPVVFLPIHIVWIELVIHPTAILGFQISEEKKRYSPAAGKFFERKGIINIFAVSFIVLITLSYLFASGLKNAGEDVARTQTIAALCLWSAFSMLVITKGKTKPAKLISALTVVTTVILIQFTGIVNGKLHLSPLSLAQWLGVVFPVSCGAILLYYLKNRKAQASVTSANLSLSS